MHCFKFISRKYNLSPQNFITPAYMQWLLPCIHLSSYMHKCLLLKHRYTYTCIALSCQHSYVNTATYGTA